MKRSVLKAIKNLKAKVDAAKDAQAKAEADEKAKIIKAYKKAIVSYNETIDALVKAGLSPKKELVISILREAGEETTLKAIEAYEDLKKEEEIQNLINKENKTKEELLRLLSKKNRTEVLDALNISRTDWSAWSKFKRGLLIEIRKFQDKFQDSKRKADKREKEKKAFDEETKKMVSERAKERAESLMSELKEGGSVNL